MLNVRNALGRGYTCECFDRRRPWRGVTALNATSIGIEIVNDGNNGHREGPFAPYDPAQVEAVVALVKDIATRYRVQPHHIVGHSDIAPQRKQDPGPAFPWERLVQAGLVPWPDEALVAEAQARFTGAETAAWLEVATTPGG